MRTKFSFLILVLAIGFSACAKKEEPKNTSASSIVAGTHKAVVQEVLQVTQYTYVRVNENGNDFWVAAPKTNIEKGAVVYFGATMEMKNFKSTDLNRVFDSVFFVQEISTSPVAPGTSSPHNDEASTNVGQKPVMEKAGIVVAKVPGGISVAALYSNLSKYEGKSVKIRGKILKLNSGIMGKNWVHIQDGTEYKGKFDLTVTTLSDVKVGDDVTFQGKISLNKDFGYGYSYPVLLEDAKATK
jgi:hypothetical protein